MKKIFFVGALLVVLIVFVLCFEKFHITDVMDSVLNAGLPVNQMAGSPQGLARGKNTICYRQKILSPAKIEVSIYAQNIDKKLLGVGFDFNFKNAEFINYSHGDFFERGGEPVYMVKLSKNRSRIISGITLKRGDILQNGSGQIISFYFNARKTDGDFAFSNPVAATIENSARKDIRDIKWGKCE